MYSEEIKRMLKPDIRKGSSVVIDTQHENPELALRASQWKHAYKDEWPLSVFARTNEHVVLANKRGEVVHFGGDNTFLHVNFIELHAQS
jgi:hypothetical protein